MTIDRHEISIRLQTVGQYLRLKRLEAKLTQTAVAERLGYKTSQFISNWERGLSLPPNNILPDLVELYGLDPAELVEALDAYQREMLSYTQKKLLESLKSRSRL